MDQLDAGSDDVIGISRRTITASTGIAILAAAFGIQLGADARAIAAVNWLHPFATRVPVNSPWGPRANTPAGSDPFHTGCDFAPGAGTPVYSAAAGTVAALTDDASFGNCLMLDHSDGYKSFYAHMQAPAPFSIGQSLSASTRVGSVGATGNVTGPHLHFEIHTTTSTYRRNSIDPAPLVADAPLAGSSPAPQQGASMNLVKIIFDKTDTSNPAFASTAVYNETIGWVQTSSGYGSRDALNAYDAIANTLGFTVTEKHVDANGWTLSQLFKAPVRS